MLGTACSAAAGVSIGIVFAAAAAAAAATTTSAPAAGISIGIVFAGSAAAAAAAAAVAGTLAGEASLGSTVGLTWGSGNLSSSIAHVLAVTTCCGVLGCALDSVLGAHLQYSGFDKAKGKVVGKAGQVRKAKPWYTVYMIG